MIQNVISDNLTVKSGHSYIASLIKDYRYSCNRVIYGIFKINFFFAFKMAKYMISKVHTLWLTAYANSYSGKTICLAMCDYGFKTVVSTSTSLGANPDITYILINII